MALVDNLVSYYNFERNANDSKGTNDGVPTAVSWARSLNNLAARFGGSVSSISAPNDVSLQITGDLSIAFQIIPNSLDSNQDVIAKSNNGEYYISLLGNGDIVFTHGDGGAGLENFNLLDSGSFLTVGEKAHILITRNSSTNTIVAYKNGQQITSTSYTTIPLATTTDLTIGDDLDYNELDADLDELAIWNRVLDSTEASDLYNDGKLQVYDSESDSFVASTGYKRYSLLSEDGDAGDFWTQLVDKDRYLESEEVVLTQGGLLAEYYDGQDFDTLDTTRIDSTVDFDFGNSEPTGTNVGGTDYSIRWTGYLVPDFTETYTLYIGSDDGTRLYIDGDLLIDNWADQGYNQESETIALEAGKYYHVEIEFYQSGGGAEVDFYWESASQAYEVVPSTNLYYTVETQSYNVYSTIADWHFDKVRDLPALAEKEILDIRGQWTSSTPEINLSGWTTDVDNDYFVVIQALELSKPGVIYSKPALPSHFRIESTQASSPAITIDGFSVELKNIQAESEDDVISIDTNTGDVVRILFSHLRNTNQSSAGINTNNNAGRVDVAGTVIENASDGVLATTNNTGIVYIVDSTITECINGITTNDTEVRPTSCAVFNNTDDFNGTFPENWPKYCASDDNDVGVLGIDISPGATESNDWDDAFVDYTNGDFRIASDTSVLYESAEPYLGSTYYAQSNIPYLDAGNAPRPQNDIGAFSFTNWWDYRYIERFQITVPSAEVPTDLTDFTLYIDLSKISGTSGIWRRADSNGLDLRVTNSERSRVPQELVFIDTALKDGEIWAKVDLSSTEDTTFYVYYNYTPFSEEPDSPDYPPANNIDGQYEVWSDYEAVWHLQSLDILDSTSNGYDGTVRGTPTVATDGRFGYSIEWNETGAGNEESADVGNIQTDSTWTAITIESWFRKDSTGDERMICKSEGGTNVADHIFALHSQDRGNFISTRIGTDTTDAVTFDGDITFTTGTWQFATAIWDSTDDIARLFVNGQPDNTYAHTGNHIATSSQQVEIANVDNSTINRFWEGGLDEIRVAKVRFPNYQERLEAQYNNQTSEAFGDAAPQPDTNPVLPPIEEIVSEGTWTGSVGASATLNIDVDIPELTGKLALIIGVTNEDDATSQVDSITLDGVNPTKAGQDRQGTGYSNTSEIWYYLNDDLPATPGTYTVSITMTANPSGVGATIALYDIILQEAPVYSGNNVANDDVISTDATVDTSISESNLVFEVASSGDSNTSTISDNQTQIVDIEVGTSGFNHAASFGVYYDSGTEEITRTYSGSTNRLAQSILVLKSSEEKNYTYTGIGTISATGNTADSLIIEIIFEGIDGATIGGAADTDFEKVYLPAGGVVLSGDDVIGTLHFVYEAIPVAITLAGESDYFPEFVREGAGGLLFNGTVPEFDTVELIFIPVGTAFHVGGSDYFIEFVREGEGGINFNGAVNEADQIDITFEVTVEAVELTGAPNYFPEFVKEGTGGLVFNEIDDVAEYTIEFVREADGRLIFNEVDDTTEYTVEFERTGTGDATLSYASDPANDRDIELSYTADPREGNILGGADIAGTPGVNYYPLGAAITAGEVDADLIVVIFAPTEGGATLSGASGDRTVDIVATVETDGIKIDDEIFTQADYFPVYAYEAETKPARRTLRTNGSAPFVIPPSQFFYEASGRATFRSTIPVDIQIFANKSYTGSGGAIFRKTHRLVRYSYSADYIAPTVTGAAIFGGSAIRGTFTISAIEPSGNIVVNDAGDIVADETIWTWEYTPIGSIRIDKNIFASAVYSINYSYVPFRHKTPRFKGTAGLTFISSLYSYTGSGGMQFFPASNFEYDAVNQFGGSIVFSGELTVGDGVELVQSYTYTGSGRISVDYPPTFAQADYDPELAWSGEGGLKTNGTVVGEIDIANYDASGQLVFNEISGESDYEHAISYIASGSLIFTTPVITEQEANYIDIASGGKVIFSGSADFKPEFVYVAISTGGELVINGISSIVFQEYEAESSGSSRLILSGDVVADEIDIFYKYSATGGAIFKKFVRASRSIEYIYTVKSYPLETNGISLVKLAGFNYPNYDGDPAITTLSGSVLATYDVLYDYTASITPIALSGIASYEYDAQHTYESSGAIELTGTVVADERAVDYLYTITGAILGGGSSDSIGQNFHEYDPIGNLQINGVTQVNYRFVKTRLTNITEAPRTLREPLASKVFTFETNG